MPSFPDPQIKQVKESRNSTVDVFYWTCACGRELGEGSAVRSWELHEKIICPECAQKANPVYQEWLKSPEGMKAKPRS
jgi:hypothetical protein